MQTIVQKQKPAQQRTLKIVRSGTVIRGANRRTEPSLHLQRALGNEAVQRLLRANSEDIKTHSHTNAAHPFGHDFSRAIQRKCAACESEQGLCPECAEKEESEQRTLRAREVTPALERDISEDGKKKAPGAKKEGKKEPEKKKEESDKCPIQTVTMSGAKCGAEYGAVGKYCYSGATRWWFKEKVVMGSPKTCVPRATIDQTSTPFQESANCVRDEIMNQNGPPSSVAPCEIVTKQTVFTGPTKDDVEKCKYNNEQIVKVTVTKGSSPKSGKVVTTSAGVSTDCDWP